MLKLDIFCTVIDNYGDAGVCLHLARTMSHHGYQVKLWCDQLEVLEQIKNKQSVPAATTSAGVRDDNANELLEIKSWTQDLADYTCPDVVINAFNCRLNPIILQRIQEQEPKKQPLVINLEYLSAEEWIEGCHGLVSPADGISCYYFFPGFTPRTGGLNIDADFVQACLHQLAPLSSRHSAEQPPVSSISLFSYHNAALKPFLQASAQADAPLTIQVFTGLALDNLNTILGANLKVGDVAYLNTELELQPILNKSLAHQTESEKVEENLKHSEPAQLRIEVMPMLSQEGYDQVLLQSSCNLVRGEDSIVRAMHTGHPFLWQIYEQAESAHIVKLQSFIDRMKAILLEATELPTINPNFELDFAYLERCMLAYNNACPWPDDFSLKAFMERTAPLFAHFAQYLCQQDPLYVRLNRFLESKLADKL